MPGFIQLSRTGQMRASLDCNCAVSRYRLLVKSRCAVRWRMIERTQFYCAVDPRNFSLVCGVKVCFFCEKVSGADPIVDAGSRAIAPPARNAEVDCGGASAKSAGRDEAKGLRRRLRMRCFGSPRCASRTKNPKNRRQTRLIARSTRCKIRQHRPLRMSPKLKKASCGALETTRQTIF
jgi:hypothetical protein